jgi:hypothetical protein
MRWYPMSDVATLLANLCKRAGRYGITVGQQPLDGEVPGRFDGPTIVLNQDYDPTERAFYLAHSIGSIAQWSLERERSEQIFRELKAAKQKRETAASSFAQALAAYLDFEETTWERSVWLLGDLEHNAFILAFTNFGRADMESMRIFHSTGKAPVWRDFFAGWNDEIRRGARKVEPLVPRSIPDFRAIKIPEQEIVQEDDGQ